MLKSKFKIAAALFLTDIALSVWSYFKLSNYEEFMKITKVYVNSPDLLLQIYQMFIQAFIFGILLFLFFHLLVYILYIRHKKFTTRYLRFYSLLAALSCLIIIVTGYPLAGIVPLAVYVTSYVSIKKLDTLSKL